VRNQRQAYAAQMVATGVQHAPAAVGATVRFELELRFKAHLARNICKRNSRASMRLLVVPVVPVKVYK
jgi:hypothetical protein